MASSLSNFVYKLVEGVNKTKCKDCDCFFEYESINENLINYKCLFCNKIYLKWFMKIKKRFKHTSTFSNDINKFILLLRKGVCPYKFYKNLKEEQFYKKTKKNFIKT